MRTILADACGPSTMRRQDQQRYLLRGVPQREARTLALVHIEVDATPALGPAGPASVTGGVWAGGPLG